MGQEDVPEETVFGRANHAISAWRDALFGKNGLKKPEPLSRERPPDRGSS
jgi:hypothetical protein